MRRVLLVSPHFPPSTLAGVHRSRHLAKHLPAHGWQPRVVTVDPRFHAEPLDHDLARLVPGSVAVRRVGAIPARLARPFGVGDVSLRGFLHLRAAIADEIRRAPPQVALLTGGPFYALLLAGLIRERHGVPVVLDFQDPWVSDAGASASRWSKRGLAHRLALRLEPHAVGHASAITSVSDTQNMQMVARYPFLKPVPTAAIPIGIDPDDFAELRAMPPRNATHPFEPGKVNLSYVGTALPRAEAALATLMRAAQRLEARAPALARRLRLNFVGTSNQPGETSPEGRVTAIARAAGVAHLVAETPRRVPYLEALSLLARSDGLLLIGSDEPHYTASKIHPALMSGRPFLSLFHAASSSHRILSEAGGGLAFAFADTAELPALEEPLAEGLRRLAAEPASLGSADPGVCRRYTADAVAEAYADLFDRIAEGG